MAKMLPEAAPKRLSKPVTRVYSQLKKIESEDLVCRLSYALNEKECPEFFVLYRERYVFLLAVSSCTTEDLDAMVQGELFTEGSLACSLDLAERYRLEAFVRTVADEIANPGPEELPVQKWLLFPRASSASVDRLAQIANWPGYRLFGREECRSSRLCQHFQGAATLPLDELVLKHLQGQFSPETVIPRDWAPMRVAESRSHAATQTDFFLDYDQEAAVKRDLELSQEAQEAAENGRLRVITGVAGCGKTLVLLHRARMMADLQQGAQILVLMHNKALRADLGARIKKVDPDIRIVVTTFYSWIRKQMRFDVIPLKDQDDLIRTMAHRYASDLGLSVVFLREEFDWISDHAVDAITEDWYLNVERIGRRRALQKTQRTLIYRIYRGYRRELAARQLTDWGGVPVRFWQNVKAGKIRIPSYDAIFVDEAQFFAPVWFASVKRALNPQTGQLFMVADPTQGFLRSGQSWQQILGREVRGRSQRLEQPYRNTRQILDFARCFYLQRLPTEDGEVNLPGERVLAEMPEGEIPRLLQTGPAQDERARVANEVTAALGDNLRPGQILIIHADQRQVQPLVQHLEERHPEAVVDATDAQDRDRIRVCSINACTGLEASVVVFLGIDIFFEEERHLYLDDFERNDLIQANTKRIFVAFTRATQRLLICCRHDATRRRLEAVLEMVKK